MTTHYDAHPTQATAPDFAKPDFPLNVWYAAAWGHEVKRDLLARKICNRDLVFFRRTDGHAAAIADMCWHRLVPLSLGKLDGDSVVCGYHGLAFDAAGRCTSMPSQCTLNPAARVRSYPVVEKHRFIWVWMGDPALADPALVPDMHWNDDPEWASDGELFHAQCNYKLIVDNLMDLTHETFVHGSSIGNMAVAETPFDTYHGPDFTEIVRWMMNIDPPPFWAAQYGKPGPVDRWQIIRFEAPATITIDVGVAKAGTGAERGDRSQGVNGYVLNTMTPETDGTTHYFWAFSRNYKIGDQNLTTSIRKGIAGVFGEDMVIFAAQQKAIDANPDKEFYNLNVDAGSVWARRQIDAMIEKETTPQNPAPVREAAE